MGYNYKELLSYHKSGSLFFDPPDTEKFYIKNKKQFGKDWEYYNKEIVYKYNSHGFRTKEFSDIDWNNSIVVLGDSNVFGTGIAEEDTISYQIEEITGIPTVNLGICGSAIDHAMVNSMILYNYYPKPKGIVQLWTSLSRYTNFEPDFLTNFLPKDKSFYKRIDWVTRSKLYIDIERSIWKNKVPRYEASFFKITQDHVDGVDKLRHVDYARDMEHPGSKSTKIAAEQIVKNLKI